MVTDRTITMFSRETRRRMSQTRRTGRGFSPPGPGQPRSGGGCCIFLIVLTVALIIYAFVESYLLTPAQERERQREKKDTSCRPVIIAKAPVAKTGLTAFFK